MTNPPYSYNIATTTAATPTRHIGTASASVIIPDRRFDAPVISHYSNRSTGEHSQAFATTLKKGTDYTFSVIGTAISENTHDDIRNDAERLTFFAAVEGPERLRARHLQEWAALWESDILIEGDPQAQQDVHNMLYHVYSFIREGSGLSLSPMGLSGFGYNGHVFWDTETWVYPAVLLLNHDMARSLLDYRYKRLDAARRNAYQHGYRGAMFPWESAATGSEETPAHNLYSHFENHINADIAIAAWQYWQGTHDIDWLRQKGYPLIKETADFWVSRVEPRRDGTEGYERGNVIGADEWGKNPGGGKNVDNNAYTTAAAMRNLDIADKAARALGLRPDSRWKTVREGLRLTRDENGIIR
ncbi:MAG: glycoside hydrolase family 65 protein, partial [Muribaculaceae bacterium]|nr:glycoside hydrolase family 65 protein [Muribaculaceae bacterium]